MFWKKIGTIIFWLAWPVWWVYFKFSPERTRLIVVSQGKVLLVQGWLSKGDWGLPGGGVKRHETLLTAAVRELREETGIYAEETALKPLGTMNHHISGLTFRAHYFVLELPKPTQAKHHGFEIIDVKWYEFSQIRGRMLNQDASYGLKQYLPSAQTQLL